jgi:hypothetical protein
MYQLSHFVLIAVAVQEGTNIKSAAMETQQYTDQLDITANNLSLLATGTYQ